MGVEKHRTVTKWKIERLNDHPNQAQLFGDVDEQDLAALAENMRKRGLRDPVEITPDGTVIAGHQRVRAAKRLGWKEIEVVVRHDLAAAGDSAIEEHFIEDNFVRRQLTPLARAKCIKRLMELEEGRSADRFGFTRKEELKARIASRMGLSARSVSRYLLLMETPAAVQRLFDRGTIPLIAAGKIALLPKKVQAEIVRRIEAGEKPAAVIAQFTAGGEAADTARAFVRLMSCLRREIPSIRGQASRVSPGRLSKSKPTLREAIAVLAEFASATGQKG